jgi:hypothetical protein
MSDNIIPFSPALVEATIDSLQDLFSMDPLQYQRQHIEAIVLKMREHRKRLETAAETGVKPRQTRIQQPAAPTAPIDPSDLGF